VYNVLLNVRMLVTEREDGFVGC